ncbi:plasmid partitioning protein RepB [Amaricoccus solimangrovi]|uniref:Plasmid partitioning protein RepB n=2 Tax=Amaricoccus solimangrovi TaxID=2589815 RepID=A0A501WBL3_9RHOB|nr:plasmid partitioning protein RepB [Amaricoccus solimangrovi]
MLDPPADLSPQALPRIRSARALRGGLMEISANSVRDIDPDAIVSEGPRDRLDVEDEGIAALAESIRQHGQQVPIMVRPAEEPDRYRIVYGRRRLAAARRLGVSVKALVRSMDDTASVVAQGQENSLRLDPSFIEKAVFVGALREAGYSSGTIQDALAISRQALSLLAIVHQSIPAEVIEAIGPAHDVGRRRWMDLTDLVRKAGVDLAAIVEEHRQELVDTASSEARFDLVFRAAAARPGTARNAAEPLRGPDGKEIGSVRRSRKEVILSISSKDDADFADWIQRSAAMLVEEMRQRWRREQSETSFPNEINVKGGPTDT